LEYKIDHFDILLTDMVIIMYSRSVSEKLM
jgi:hypothetical protein